MGKLVTSEGQPPLGIKALTPVLSSTPVLASTPVVASTDGLISIAPPASAPEGVTKNPEKKPKREWAAWTRQEEENFFSALRQVGKNFEQITERVRSRDKNQVRHYYYRLVRRMKKLLGPGFSLDARDSKDTIAAMLRWWSLLEKYSCSASKLHLKPRRRKVFAEALGSQLLKDRKRTRGKRVKGEINRLPPSPMGQTPINIEGDELCSVRARNSEAKNSNKLAPAKGTMFKRMVEGNTNCKTGAVRNDFAAKKLKQKKNAGPASVAYKKWEKAAIAGVSLVADAAEQLERGASNPNSDAPAENVLQNDICNHTDSKEADLQSTAKLKLQLFPINEVTRKALEKDEHNPHLQLTLSARKRISSVLEHLNRKWGNSSIASGELMLVPYFAHEMDIPNCQRWKVEDTAVVADLFLSVGSPAIFRLRYGWFTMADLETRTTFLPGGTPVLSSCSGTPESGNECSTTVDHASCERISQEVRQATTEPINQSPQIEENTHVTAGTVQNLDELYGGKSPDAMTEEEWADSLTDIGTGLLLVDEPKDANLNCIGPAQSCDTFDAAVAALASRHQCNIQPALVSHSTIWDAEDTCDQFSFRCPPASDQCSYNPTTNSAVADHHVDIPAVSLGFDGLLQYHVNAEAVPSSENVKPTLSVLDSPDLNRNTMLSDIYWPDSLGPFELDAPGFRPRADDVIFCDSQNNWGRLMESSLDAFRNLSFFQMNGQG